MRKTLLALSFFASALLLSGPVLAMSDTEYAQAVADGISPNWFAPSTVYGNLKVTVLVTGGKATLMHKSTNEAYNQEVLKVANKVLDSSIANGLAFDVTFKGSSLLNINTDAAPY